MPKVASSLAKVKGGRKGVSQISTLVASFVPWGTPHHEAPSDLEIARKAEMVGIPVKPQDKKLLSGKMENKRWK